MTKTVHAKKILLNVLSGMVITAFAMPAFAGVGKNNSIGINPAAIPVYDTILVNTFPGNKNSNIRLYPDARKQLLLVSANSRQKKDYQFYMFDMEGNLVTQANILNRETTVLEHIVKGNYLFEIFSNDERVQNGQLTVR